MQDQKKTRQQLLHELAELRKRVAELEALRADLVQAAERLRESEAEFRRLAEHAQDLIYRYRLTPTPGFEYVSPAATTITGYTPEEHYADPQLSLKLVHPDDRPLLEALAQGASFINPIVLRWIRKDGQMIWTEQRNVPIYDDDGNLVAIEGVAHDITERKQAEEALVRHARELAALYDTSLELNAQPDLSTLLRALVERAARLLGARMGGLYLMRPDSETLELVVSYNLPGHYAGTILRLGEGLSGRIAQTGEPMMIEDYSRWEGHATVYADAPFRRVLGVPLKVGNKVIGVINVTDDRQTGLFSQDEIRLVSLFADQAAIAIEKTRLLTETQRRAERMAALNEIGRALTSTLGLEQLYGLIYQQACRVLKVDAFYIALYDEQRGMIRFPFLYDGGENFGPSTIPLDQGPASYVIRNKAPLVVNRPSDAIEESGRFFGDLSRPSASALHVPMISGDRITGVISAQSYHENAYEPEDQQVLEVIASQAAIAIENAQLFEETRRRAEQMATVYRVGLALTSGLDMDRVLGTLDEQCRQVAATDLFYVALYSQETGLIRFPWARERDKFLTLSSSDIRTRPGMTGYVIQNRQTAYFPDTLEPDAVLPVQLLRAGGEPSRSYLGVPLILRDQVIGVISMQSYQPNAYGPDDIRLLETIATQAAIAIENARLFEEARQRARYTALLNEITHAAQSAPNFQDMLHILANRLGELIGADGAYITLWDEDRQAAILTAAYGPLNETYATLRPLPGEATMTASVLRAGHTLVAEDVFNSPHISPRIAALFPARSMLGLPLIADGEKLGAALISFNQPHRFTADEIARGEQAADQFALAIAKSQLLQTTLNERSRLQALIKSSRDGILLHSMEGRILVVNPPALQLLHLPDQPEDWLGRRISEALRLLRHSAPNMVKAARTEIRRIQKGDDPPGEGEFEVPPRTIHWLNLPVVAGSTPLGRLIVLHDVTEERAVERLRDDMTHAMVHDLRNPLGNIYTTIEVLRSGILGDFTPDQLAALKVAETSARRMMSLVSAILDMSRLESGQMLLEQKTFNLANLVAETMQAQAALASKKNIRLESAVPAALPPAWGDPTLIGRVLQNLIDNACKFTPAGGSVRVMAHAEQRHGRPVLHVSVSDTGPGIPAKIQFQLFRKFVRGQQKERGSGLGLAFCRLAIEAHGERIWVESTSEQGTTMTFSLATAQGT